MTRDDFALAPGKDCFYVFGGFVKGSRVNDLICFKADGGNLKADCVGESGEGKACPPVRASTSAVCCEDKIWVFGGQDDDNTKLNDIWCCDT